MYPRDETTLEKLFSLLPRRFLLWAQNASLPGLEPAWPGVCKPERRGRVKVTVYFPPLAAIPEEQGSGKNEVCLAFKLQFLCWCYKRWSKRKGNVIRTGMLYSKLCDAMLLRMVLMVFRKWIRFFERFVYASDIYVESIKCNTRIKCNFKIQIHFEIMIYEYCFEFLYKYNSKSIFLRSFFRRIFHTFILLELMRYSTIFFLNNATP